MGKLCSWDTIWTSQPAQALEISVKALLDMTHQQRSRFVMVTVGMVVGMVVGGPLAGHGKEDVTCKVSDPPFTNLIARSDIEEKPMLIR